ncbi:magnesium transporter CorA family protein [Paracoccus aminophilus]|uniref:Magnesium transport protein CorA n=1 Tax=Paracoccus aminophilus JCM 7686 TaxID=1367847 RepID=S5XW56_PARAH|nr:magnesium transporter CorA family protein [Paracoccus aminophilus]AGT09522.1 magnesium/cobalt transport protein [Paracoccus aminophilus JCM 7686]
MLKAYVPAEKGLALLPPETDLAAAVWIDLFIPDPDEIAAMARLGVEVPTLEDMEEIEISNRLYLEGETAYMTAMVPGQDLRGHSILGPVTFILSATRLVTVRHHEPRSFATYPTRADQSSCGVGSAERIFVGLNEEIVARMADLLEGVGRVLEQTSGEILGKAENSSDQELRGALVTVGRNAELVSRVRLCLMTLERMLTFHLPVIERRSEAAKLRPNLAAIQRDIHALQVHSDFLDARVTLVVDATMGMINLRQNTTVKILSVVAALFMPPTLIASVYGMNFAHMPELSAPWGYETALALMVASSVATFLLFRWKKWL